MESKSKAEGKTKEIIFLLKNISELTENPRNARTHPASQIKKIAKSIKEFGFINPAIIDKNGVLVAGHGRLEAAKSLGLLKIPCVIAEHLSPEQLRAYMLADNRIQLDGGWDDEILKIELSELSEIDFDLDLTGFETDEIGFFLDSDANNSQENIKSAGNLSEKFLFPPFSVLSARDGRWQARKQAWLSLGIKSEVGRGENALGFSEVCNSGGYNGLEKKKKADAKEMTTKGWVNEKGLSGLSGAQSGTSIFDPVLCELSYLWFSPKSGAVLDPFAGGSVRGVVASKLGRMYIGGELRPEQVEANVAQAKEICKGDAYPPEWICGDSREIDKAVGSQKFDFIFSCPPYADLEIYSDNPQDLSTLAYEDFKSAYFEIIKKSCSALKDNRFACFVVGEVRGKSGNYYNFVGDTIEAFQAAGLEYYNEAILVTAIGSLPIRVGKQFSASRKVGKTHQNILVFVKGDGKKAAEACGKIDIPLDTFKEFEENIELN